MNHKLKDRLKRIADWATGKTVAESPEDDNADEGPESLLSVEENLEQGQPPVVRGAQKTSKLRLRRIQNRISFIRLSHNAVAGVYSDAIKGAQEEYTARTNNPGETTDNFSPDVVFKFVNHVARLYNEALGKKKENVKAGVALADDIKVLSKNFKSVGFLAISHHILEGLLNTTAAWAQRIDELAKAQQLEEAKKFVGESYPIKIIVSPTAAPAQEVPATPAQEVPAQQVPAQQVPAQQTPAAPAPSTSTASTIETIRNRLSNIREVVKKKARREIDKDTAKTLVDEKYQSYLTGIRENKGREPTKEEKESAAKIAWYEVCNQNAYTGCSNYKKEEPASTDKSKKKKKTKKKKKKKKSKK